jgi:hypothetical protein
VVGALGKIFQDTGLPPGIDGCIGNDFLEKIGFDITRTGKGHEYSTRSQKFECKQVNIFITLVPPLSWLAEATNFGRSRMIN